MEWLSYGTSLQVTHVQIKAHRHNLLTITHYGMSTKNIKSVTTLPCHELSQNFGKHTLSVLTNARCTHQTSNTNYIHSNKNDMKYKSDITTA